MNNKLAKDVFIVFIGNIIVVLGSILTGLVTPKILGVVNYGYYKVFTLYLTYTAFLHLGFVDGILMVHGGEDYSTINKAKFQRNTVFFINLN
jgi:O-antigen/teichoic acid export membrane protein